MVTGDKKSNAKGVFLQRIGAIFLCLIACVALFVVSGLALYVYPNLRDRRALENCKNEEDVVAYFQREPEMVYRNMEQMTYYGWPLPTRPITNKMLVYTRTETRYYIYIDKDGHVEYVYVSSS
jgi:hypothetical protein